MARRPDERHRFVAAGAGQFPADPQIAPMIRLLAAGLLGYTLYRMGRRFIRRVPDDFEPAGLPPDDYGAPSHRPGPTAM